MPYENPYLDARGKTETFFRDAFLFDAFTRGSADYAYEAKGLAESMGGFNVAFESNTEDRELFMNLYKSQVINDQMIYNQLAFQTNNQFYQNNVEDTFYKNALFVEKRKWQEQNDLINKLQADASLERQADIIALRKERTETMANMKHLREEEAKVRADKYYLRRDNERTASINLPPAPPGIPDFLPVFPEVILPDADKALSMKIIIGLAVLGALLI